MVENTTVTPQRSFMERLRDRMEGRKVEGEQGSLILDILIGMAIFALIAIIAVSAIGQYRARAYEQSAVSDAEAIGLAVEASLTDQAYAAPTQAGAVVTAGTEKVTLSHGGKNVFRMGTAPTAANGYTFSLCVVHDGAEWAVYDSAAGGITAGGKGRSATGRPAVCNAPV